MFAMGPVFRSSLDEYGALVGSVLVEEIAQLAMSLRGYRVLHLTPLPWRGGLVDAVSTLISLLRDVGLAAEWQTVPINPRQLFVSRALNRALGGDFVEWTPQLRAAWLDRQDGMIEFSRRDYDFIAVHDAELMGVTEVDSSLPNATGPRWIWHCHSDPSRAQPDIYDMLAFQARQYHHRIVCSFGRATASSYQSSTTVPPTIDPLHPRNCELSQQTIEMGLGLHGLDSRRPFVLQVLHNAQALEASTHFVDGFLIARQQAPELQLLTLVTGEEDGHRALALSRLLSSKLGTSNATLLRTVADGIGSAEINALQRAALAVVGECDDEQSAIPLLEAMWKRRPAIVGAVVPLYWVFRTDGTGVWSARPRTSATESSA